MTDAQPLDVRPSPLATAVKPIAGNLPGQIAFTLAATAATFGGVHLLAAPDSLAHSVFFVAPGIAAAQTALFFLGCAMLAGKLADLSAELAVLRAPLQRILGTHAQGSITRDDAAAILSRVEDQRPHVQASVVVDRIEKSMRRLHLTGSTGELATILSELSRLDEERLDSRHTMVRFLLAVIPIVGFIGTVLGISLAISGFPELLASEGGIESLKGPIATVTGELGVAFNTTLLALVQAGLLMFAQSLVQRREEAFLSQVNGFCIRELLNRVHMESEGVQFKEAIEREIQDLRMTLAEQNEELQLAFQAMVDQVSGKA